MNPTATVDFFLPPRVREGEGLGTGRAYERFGWVHAVIGALAGNISQVPFLLRMGDERNPQTLREGPWVQLMDRINPYMQSRVQLWESIVIWLSLSGECIIIKESRGDARLFPGEIPSELWPLNGKLFDPVLDPETKLVKTWMYRDPKFGKLTFWEPHEVIHLKYYNPYDPLRGLAPWGAAEIAARTDAKISRYTENFFDNDATPSGVLVSKEELTKTQRDDLRQAWEDRHQGYNKRGRLAVLEAGLDFKSIASSNKDSELIQLRNASLNELLAVFKVPKTEVSLHENLNFATAQSADRGFWTKTLVPIMKLIEDGLWAQMFQTALRKQQGVRLRRSDWERGAGRQDTFEPGPPAFEDQSPAPGEVWGEFDLTTVESLRENLDIKVATGQKLFSMGYPLNLINDRLSLGMPKVPWGDQEPGALGSATATAVEEPPPPAVDTMDESLDSSSSPALIEDQQNSIAAFQARRGPKAEAKWKAVGRQIFEPFETRFRGRFRRFLIELRAESLRTLRAAAAKKTKREIDLLDLRAPIPLDPGDVESSLFNLDDWARRAKSLTHGVYLAVAHSGISSAHAELGGNFAFDHADPRVVDLAKAREEVMATSTTKTIRQRLAKEIARGVELKETLGTIADRIRASFNAFSGPRALMVARTEVAGMGNASRFLAFREEGVGKHEWVTAHDEAVRPTHAAQDGDQVEMGTPFPNGLEFPGDPEGEPEETINCRCVAVAVV